MARMLALFPALGIVLLFSPLTAKSRSTPTHTTQADHKEQIAPHIDQFTYAKDCCRSGSPRDEAPKEKPLPRFIRPEWVIVYITAVYVFITGITFWAIWRQGKLIANSVAVAERQVRLMENAERARITVVASRLGNYSFQFDATNIGKTSARVTYARGFCSFLDPGQSLPEVPAYLSNELIGEEPIQWVAAGANLELVEQKGNGEISPVLIADLTQEAARNNIQYHKCSMWVFGRISYQDGISPDERETRFCYGFLIEERSGTTLFYAGGPPKYRLDT